MRDAAAHRTDLTMAIASSPIPDEPDVRLCMILRGVQFHFAACRTAARVFVREQQHRRYFDTVWVAPGSAAGLRRMANERLFLEP
ncbi:hypothetical protein [Nocardia abscessus]|uniref:hypothetical protein n=1 Tax=Nocardia abscessus TaxID=120957 RepID=UPI0024568974|nr:hypothetical protein [Nocardia abscessus]